MAYPAAVAVERPVADSDRAFAVMDIRSFFFILIFCCLAYAGLASTRDLAL